ncbi:MAG: trehalose-phosphatase [Myxococcota bacterium]
MTLLDRVLGLKRPLLIGLDVDGTLAPIVENPDAATIPEGTLASLERLGRAEGVVLALITGRDLQSLSRMEQIDGIWRGVEHGGVVIAPGEQPTPRAMSESHRGALERFDAWTREHAEGAFIEHKPGAIAVHVRVLAQAEPTRAKALLEEAEAFALSVGLHPRQGRALVEVEAVSGDKGEALREIFSLSGARSVLFVGDDVTDLPAIEFANRKGLGAFVVSSERGAPPGTSTTTLDGVGTVATLLAELARRLG